MYINMRNIGFNLGTVGTFRTFYQPSRFEVLLDVFTKYKKSYVSVYHFRPSVCSSLCLLPNVST
jgi:hypothetical protein